MMLADIPPSQTIYINNLNEKVKKDELKRSLYALFSQFGKIVDIVALKTISLRGQAWVVFDEVTAATNALRQLQSFPFYDKPIKIHYAKTKSDVIAKVDGTFVPKEKRRKMEEKAEKKKREHQSDTTPGPAPSSTNTSTHGAAPTMAPPGQPAKPTPQEPPAPPNNILFVQNLPNEANSMMLQMLFQQFPGFKEVRMIDSKPGIAFVEYSDDGQSTAALQALQGFKITPKNAMQISYAKK